MTQAILKVLETLEDPLTHTPLGMNLIKKEIHVQQQQVEVNLCMPYYIGADKAFFKQHVSTEIERLGYTKAIVNIEERVQKHVVQGELAPLKNIKNIIAVASGKGGVGKSTTTVNLALALAKDGASVGILDADIYGPSQPLLLGLAHEKPDTTDDKLMEPLSRYGVQVNSIGFLVDPESPAIWRAPMVCNALEQLLKLTNWHDLDYLIIDMPPGTGDVALTLSQKIPVVGAVIVTTPQDLALIDARKGLNMFHKVHVPVLGVIENMAVYTCPACAHQSHLFGCDGGKKMADELSVPYLGALPLTYAIREKADLGQPTVVGDPDSQEAQYYATIARKIAISVAQLEVDTKRHFPKFMMKSQ